MYARVNTRVALCNNDDVIKKRLEKKIIILLTMTVIFDIFY